MWGPGTPWKNETAWWTFLRGLFRRGWNHHPWKIEKIKADRKQIPNPNPKGNKSTVWGATCAMCHKDFVLKDIQVDHIEPAGSLKCEEDMLGFIKRLLFVTKDDLRLVCKDCNSALSLVDKRGISYEEAIAEKQAIAIMKSKKEKEWLLERGITPASNATKRRQQVKEALSNV